MRANLADREQQLLSVFPWIPWLEPYVGSRGRLACRLCVGVHGPKSQDAPGAGFASRGSWESHVRAEHRR